MEDKIIKKKIYDFVIVGLGSIGSTTASFLAREGYRRMRVNILQQTEGYELTSANKEVKACV